MRDISVFEKDMACIACMNNSDLSTEKMGIKRNWRSRITYFLKRSSQTTQSSSHRKSYRPTADEVNQWARSLDKLLSHKYGKAAFQIFLKSEFCEENIEFWTACEEFRQIKSPAKLTLRAKCIYEEFIKSESPKEINLDFYTKDAIVQSLLFPTASCFFVAQKNVYSLMENNSYPRFIQSELYSELCTVAWGKSKYLRS